MTGLVDESPMGVETANVVVEGLLPNGHGLTVLGVERRKVLFRAETCEPVLALGGSISGPALFELVDYAAFAAVNVLVPGTRAAVLAQSSVNFLESAQVGPLELRVVLLQAGSNSGVTDVRVFDSRGWLVVSALLSFSLPRRRGRAATSSALPK